MLPVEPTDQPSTSRLVVFAKDQPEYIPLPAYVDIQGSVTTEWELSAEELTIILNGGKIRLEILYLLSDPHRKAMAPIKIQAIP